MTIYFNNKNNKINKQQSNLIDTDGYIDVVKLDFKQCFDNKCLLVNQCSKINDINKIKCGKNLDKPLVIQDIKPRVYDNKFSIKNTKTTEFLTNICELLTGESNPSLLIKYCALSTSFDIPTQDSPLELELGRVAVTSIERDGLTITVISNIGMNDCNTLSTAISSVTSASIFNLTSVVGLSIGDRLKVNLDTGSEENKISNISGNQITLQTPLSKSPTIDDIAEQMISRLHLITGGTVANNSGTGLSLSSYITTKKSTETLIFTHTIKLK